MRLTSTDGSFVDLRIARYQFAKGSGSDIDKDWDANWLVVEGEILSAAGAWRFTDPCLTTWEAQSLASWLRGVVSGQVAPCRSDLVDGEGSLVFLEPCIAFSLRNRDDDYAAIRVHFSHEAGPPWATGDIFEYFVVLDLPMAAIVAAAGEWEKELSAFPKR